MKSPMKTAVAMLILLPLPILQGCGDDGPVGPVEPVSSHLGGPELPGLAVFPATLQLPMGESTQLGVFLERMGDELVPPELQVTWSSSDPEVASVSADGTVTARGEGRVLIQAHHGGLSGRAWVIVPGEA